MIDQAKTKELLKHVDHLLNRASKADDSGDAMRYAQAALNAANAVLTLQSQKE